jgi:hypothetical protein
MGFLGLAASVNAPHFSPEPPNVRTLGLPPAPMRMRKRGQNKSRNLRHAIRRKRIATASRKRNWISA